MKSLKKKKNIVMVNLTLIDLNYSCQLVKENLIIFYFFLTC